jgi:hypothetical protein
VELVLGCVRVMRDLRQGVVALGLDSLEVRGTAGVVLGAKRKDGHLVQRVMAGVGREYQLPEYGRQRGRSAASREDTRQTRQRMDAEDARQPRFKPRIQGRQDEYSRVQTSRRDERAKCARI